MLRLLSLGSVLLVVTLTLAVGAARWIGQQRPVDIPLPESDGCWLTVCFFDPVWVNDLPAALNADPQIVDGSAALIPDLQPGGSYLFELQFGLGSRSRPVFLYWLPHTYTLGSDWRDPENPPLWRLGDIVQAFGEPFMVTFLSDQVVLHYPERHLQVMFFAAELHWDWVRITPEDTVISVNVISSDIAGGETDQIFYPPASEWAGFGVYRFEG